MKGKIMQKVLVIGCGVLTFFALIVGLLMFSGSVGYTNQAVQLENAIKAQEKACMLAHDTMRNIVFGKAGVAEAYGDKFEAVYSKLVSGRYGNDSQVMMKFITESNPTFDSSLYKDVSRAIEEQRLTFQEAQKRAVDLQREHNNLLDQWPGSMYLAGRKHVDVKLVTSTATEKAFESGKDDTDPNPFSKSKD